MLSTLNTLLFFVEGQYGYSNFLAGSMNEPLRLMTLWCFLVLLKLCWDLGLDSYWLLYLKACRERLSKSPNGSAGLIVDYLCHEYQKLVDEDEVCVAVGGCARGTLRRIQIYLLASG